LWPEKKDSKFIVHDHAAMNSWHLDNLHDLQNKAALLSLSLFFDDDGSVDVNDATHTTHDFMWGIHDNFQISKDQAGMCSVLGHTTWEEMFLEIMKFHLNKTELSLQ
jgi:hypothetical protein